MKKLDEISNKIGGIRIILVGLYLMDKPNDLNQVLGLGMVILGLLS